MVQILAHRGIWRDKSEQNTSAALSTALQSGYGIETDIRDRDGRVVISHDMPVGAQLDLDDFLRSARNDGTGMLALNVKADGMAETLAPQVSQLLDRCFFFDMSVPDMRSYFTARLPVYTRHSDAETSPSFYEQADGVWLDELSTEWVTSAVIRTHLANDKKVAVVSGELHRRAHERSWAMVREFADNDAVMICTDFPERYESGVS